MLKLLVLAAFICAVSSLGIGRTQSSGVSGKLICDGKPAAGVTVKLYDDDRDFLHNNGVVYRDLKLENIVLDSLGHVRVVDFGLSKQLLNGEYTETICGTLQYMSPDVACEKPYSHYVDWWSLAVLLHILATGRYPYPNANATHHQELRFVDYSTPLECENNLGKFFDEMLVPSLSKRLCTFDAFRKHDFFKSIDFDDVLALKYYPLDEIMRKDDNSDTTSIIDWDSEESMEAFGENYEFESFDYFNDED